MNRYIEPKRTLRICAQQDNCPDADLAWFRHHPEGFCMKQFACCRGPARYRQIENPAAGGSTATAYRSSQHAKGAQNPDDGRLPPVEPIGMARSVAREIHQTIGRHAPERGGMLGGDWKTRTVSHFFYDGKAKTSGSAYTPDIGTVNAVLDQWNAQGIRLMGFVHSHPDSLMRPSWADEEYAARMLDHIVDMPAFLLPIVQTSRHRCRNRGSDRTFQIHPYSCERIGNAYEVLPLPFVYID